jgi:hypothetical protein
MDGKYPTESLTEDEARLRHPGGELEVWSIVTEDGERRDAIFIFEEDDGSGEQAAIALYWFVPTKLH